VDPNALIPRPAFQFAFTIKLHIIFPAFSIGLSAYVATAPGALEAKPAKGSTSTGWRRFWTEDLRAVSFRHGGVVLGHSALVPVPATNWGAASPKSAGQCQLDPLIRLPKVLTAFFLEANLLGVIAFRLAARGPRGCTWTRRDYSFAGRHGPSSGFWILAAN